MSTKAFDFYIFERQKLPVFLKWAEEKITVAMLDRFISVPKLSEWLNNPFDNEVESYCHEMITKTMQSPCYTPHDEFDLNCAVSIWIWNDNVVVKLFGLSKFVNVKTPRYMKDFEYWNNTDKPDDISGREWDRRRRFYHGSVDNLQRIEYRPFDFLSNSRSRAILDLHHYYKDLKKKIKEEKK